MVMDQKWDDSINWKTLPHSSLRKKKCQYKLENIASQLFKEKKRNNLFKKKKETISYRHQQDMSTDDLEPLYVTERSKNTISNQLQLASYLLW